MNGKVRAVAWNTFHALLRNKVIILFLAGFVCVLLLMMTPLLLARGARAGQSQEQMQAIVLPLIGAIMGLVSGFGSLLAAWAAADAVAGEMKSGTILAVMARPVHRWEFLLGKYLGTQLLMLVYVIAMLGLNYLMAAIGGASIHASPWLLIVYPMVRYAIFSAIALFLVAVMHPIIAFGLVLVISIAAQIVSPASAPPTWLPDWLRTAIFHALPSTALLSEIRFLTITRSTLKVAPFADHLTALAYGLDYALVCFLLAVWLFHKRSLSRE